MPQRDEAGRFMSDDERRGRGRYEDDERLSRSRYEDDDRRSGTSRGREGAVRAGGSATPKATPRRPAADGSGPTMADSGWYGDREGHSEASRRGWENSGPRPQRLVRRP